MFFCYIFLILLSIAPPIHPQCFLDDQNPPQCLFCDYQYYETYYSTYLKLKRSTENAVLTSNECLKKSQILINRKVFIMSFSTTPVTLNLTGFDAIYNNLSDAFFQESVASCKYDSYILNIILQNGQHFITNENQTIIGSNFFRRTMINLTLQKEASPGKAKIIFSTANIYIFISSIFIVKNIDFEGNYLKVSNYSQLNFDKYYALFNLELIFDNPNSIPNLKIENCSFSFFQPSQNNDFYITLFSLSPVSGIFEIVFCEFLGNFFPTGVISNSLINSEAIYIEIMKIIKLNDYSNITQTINISNIIVSMYENLDFYTLSQSSMINIFNYNGNVTILNFTAMSFCKIFSFLVLKNDKIQTNINLQAFSMQNISESRGFEVKNCRTFVFANSSFQKIGLSKGDNPFILFNSIGILLISSIKLSEIILPTTFLEILSTNATISNVILIDITIEKWISLQNSNISILSINVTNIIFQQYFIYSKNGNILKISDLNMNKIQGNATFFSVFCLTNQKKFFLTDSNFERIFIDSFITISQTIFCLFEKISIFSSVFDNLFDQEPDCLIILVSKSNFQKNILHSSFYLNSYMANTDLIIRNTIFKNNNCSAMRFILVFEGSFSLNVVSFENNLMLEPDVFEYFLDCELNAKIYIINVYFYENGILQKKNYYLSKVNNCLFSLWKMTYSFFDQIKVVMTSKNELASGVISAVPHTGMIQISNSIFVILNANPSFKYKGIYLDTVMVGIFQNNTFLNLICNNMTFFHQQGVFLITGSPRLNYVKNDYFVAFLDNSFLNCSCFYGGSLAVVGMNRVIIKNTIFYNSTAINNGGHLFLASNYYTDLINLTMSYSNAIYGGAIYSFNIFSFFVIKLNVSYSSSKSNGGIYCADIIEIKITKSSFFKNRANSKGGVFYIFNSLFEFSESSISNSKANLAGGVGYFSGQSVMVISYVSIKNSSSYFGGGFCIDSISDGKFNFITFDNTTSDLNGGVFFIDITMNLFMNFIYVSNSLARNIGLIYVKCDDDFSVITIQNSTFQKTRSVEGSFIYFLSGAKLNLMQITLINNFAPVMSLWSFLSTTCEVRNLLILSTFGICNIFDVSGMSLDVINSTISQTNLVGSCFSLHNSNSSFSNIKFINNILYDFVFNCISSMIIIKNIKCENIDNANDYTASFLYLEKSDAFLTNGTVLTLYSQWVQTIYAITGSFELENFTFVNNGPYQIIFGINIFLQVKNCYFNNTISISNIELSFLQKDIKQEAIFLNSTIVVHSSTGIKITGIPFNLSIKNCKFMGDIINSNETTGIYLQNCFILYVENTIAKNFTKNSFYVETNPINIKRPDLINFINSSFLYNKGTLGSSIYIRSLISGFFFNCSFLKNEANSIYGMGPCLAFFTDSYLISEIIFLDNLFINNTSGFIAPTIYSEVPIKNWNNTFIGNWDAYNETSLFFSLNFTLNYDESNVISIKSGIPFTLEISLTDFYKNILIFDNRTSITLKTGADFMVQIENNLFQAKKGLFILKDITVRVNSNSSFPLFLEANFFGVQNEFDKTMIIEPHKITQLIKFQSLLCSIGEILKEDQSCKICPNGSYSLIDPMLNQTHFLKCLQCPPNADCFNGMYVTPQAGFYRYSNDSLLMTSCFQSEFCLGFRETQYINYCDTECQKTTLINGVCLAQTFGEFCFYCISGFFKSSSSFSDTSCVSCVHIPSVYYIQIVIIIFGSLLFLLGNGVSAENIQIKEGVFDNFNTMNKILINHFQQVSIIFNPRNIPLGFISNFLNIFQIFSFPLEILNNVCYIQDIYFDPIDQFVINAFVFMIIPYLISFVGALFRWILSLLKKLIFRSKKYELLSFHETYIKFRLYFVISIFMYYPQVIKAYFTFFNCMAIDKTNGISVLKASPNLQCWKDFHLKITLVFGLPGLIFCCLISQLYLFAILRLYNKMSLKTNQNITTILKKSPLSPQKSSMDFCQNSPSEPEAMNISKDLNFAKRKKKEVSLKFNQLMSFQRKSVFPNRSSFEDVPLSPSLDFYQQSPSEVEGINDESKVTCLGKSNKQMLKFNQSLPLHRKSIYPYKSTFDEAGQIPQENVNSKTLKPPNEEAIFDPKDNNTLNFRKDKLSSKNFTDEKSEFKKSAFSKKNESISIKTATYQNIDQLFNYFQNFKNEIKSENNINKRNRDKLNLICSMLSLESSKYINHVEKLGAVKKHIQNIRNCKMFSFFYKDLRVEFYYWECIIFLRKFALSAFVNLPEILPEEINNLFLLLILLGFILITMLTRPYIFNKANNLEIYSLIVCIYSLFSSIILNSNCSDSFKLIIAITFFIFNLHFMIICVVYSFCDLKNKLKETKYGRFYQNFLQIMGRPTSLKKSKGGDSHRR